MEASLIWSFYCIIKALFSHFQENPRSSNSADDSESTIELTEPAVFDRRPLESCQKKSRFAKSEVDLHIHQENLNGQPGSQVLSQEAVFESDFSQPKVAPEKTTPRKKVEQK